MQCDLLSPFRLPLVLPSRHIRANPDKWSNICRQAKQKIADDPTVSLGNFAWAQLEERQQRNQDLYTGGSFFFVQHHLLLLQGTTSIPEEPVPLVNSAASFNVNNPTWEIRLYDNCLAVLVLRFDIDIENDSVQTETDASLFDKWAGKWVEALLTKLSTQDDSPLPRALAWITEELVQPFMNSIHAAAWKPTDQKDPLTLGENPVYRNVYQRLWTHHAYSFSDSEIKNQIYKLIPETVAYNGNRFDFGNSVRRSNGRSDLSWREAASVSQYYYSCLDITDTGLPIEIARQRVAILEGRSHQVLIDSERISNRLQVLQHDYVDIRTRADPVPSEVLEGYHQSWRFDLLHNSIDKKLGLLQQLNARASDRIQERNNDLMNTILFIIGVLGILSLFTGLHEYLSGGMNSQFYDELPQLALGIGKGDVLLGAILAAFAALLIFLFLRKSR